MEFPFNINNLFSDEIYKVDSNITPARSSPGSNEYKSQLITVIDLMGEASARAQGLSGAITSAQKLGFTDHILYVMKDAAINRGKGAVVGILKIGTKKLFVYDNQSVQHEMEPLCVLDFYVHESRQRMGCGRKLFDFMLRDQNLKAVHLAIDRPSHKFSQFLQKHYNLTATIPQVNHFVIFKGFFNDRNRSTFSRNSLDRPPGHSYNRQSTIPSPGKNHWLNQQKSPERSESQTKTELGSLKGVSPTDHLNSRTSSARSLKTNETDVNLPASKSMYSRHTLNPTSPLPQIGQIPTNTDNQADRVPSPPPLTRDGVPSHYTNLLNLHLDVMDRNGHLKTADSKPSASVKRSVPSHDDSSLNTDSHLDTKENGGDVQRRENGVSDGRQPTSSLHQLTSATKCKIQDNSSDVLLPKNFTPYSHLSLPPGDPYKYRQSAKRLNDSGWNVFGIPSEPKNYSANDRYRNTRPW